MRLTALFVDGSLNRIAAMAVVDTMVFTTGASRTTDVSFLSEEAHAVCSVFNGKNYDLGSPADGIELQDASGSTLATVPMRSLFDADDARSAVDALTVHVSRIVVPNMVSLQALEYMTKRLGAQSHAGLSIIVSDPTIALLAGEPIALRRWMDASAVHGISIGYRHAIRAAAMTVNPFYPLQHDHSFTPAYIDKDSLLDAVTAAVNVPVHNIKDEGAASTLYDQLLL